MKKYAAILISFSILPLFSIAQHWSCVNGIKIQSAIGSEVKREPSSLNEIISARHLSSGAIINENYYLFGGYGFNMEGTKVPLNDFWRYDILNASWNKLDTEAIDSLEKNDINTKTVKKRIPSPRASSACWPYNDKFYVFGGFGFDENGKYTLNNQVWCFDLAKNYWIQLKGDTNLMSNGIRKHDNYVVDSKISPSARCNLSTWVINDKLYLLGGFGWNEKGKLTKLSDFWCYHIETNKWEQLSKDSSEYISDIENFQVKKSKYPYFISDAVTFVIDNSLFIYGGYCYNEDSVYDLSGDLRKYDVISKTWTRLSMSSFKELDLEESRYNLTHPGLRSNAVSWVHKSKMYLYGGNTIDSKGELGRMNDLWSYDSYLNKWERLNGDKFNYNNATAHFQVVNNYEEINTPGARINALSFTYNHELYLFGGFVSTEHAAGLFNDLWKFNIPYIPSSKHSSPPYISLGSKINIEPAKANTGNNAEGGNSNATILQSDDICFSPSPVLNEAYIFSVNSKGRCKYKIFSTNGTEWMHGELNEMLTNRKYLLELSSLHTGNYFFNLTTASQSTTIHFTKQ